MKFLGVAMLFWALVPVVTWAQTDTEPTDTGRFDIRLGAGIGLPMGDFSDFGNTGPIFGGAFGFKTSPRIQIGGEIYYSKYDAKNDYFMGDQDLGYISEADLKFSIIQFGAFFRYLLSTARNCAYLQGGLGYYQGKTKGSIEGYTWDGVYSISGDVDETGSDFGLNAGVGYQFLGGGKLGFFGEGVFNYIFSKDSESGEESTQFIALRVGLIYLFGG